MRSSPHSFGLPEGAWGFGSTLRSAFNGLASAPNLGEVRLFGYLKDAFALMSPTYFVDVYHGQRSQVYQKAQPPRTRSKPVSGMVWGPNSAQCELADVALVWYRTGASPQARVTFLQAKKSKKPALVCPSADPITAPFQADSTQWHLLNQRPPIAGAYPSFQPPSDLLSGALLASVASYGVFHEVSTTNYDMFYASANCVQAPTITAATPSMKCSAKGSRVARAVPGFPEAEIACCLEVFGAHLYHGNIGTPIHPDSSASAAQQAYRRTAGAFVMRQIVESAPGGDVGRAGNELGSLLGMEGSNNVRPRKGLNVIVVRGTEEEELA